MKTSALVLIVALAGLDPLAASVVASQTGTSDSVSSALCDIPNVIGLSHDQAIQRLYSGDFSVSVETRPSRTPRGVVIEQRPRQCRTSADGRRVVVVVSTGPSDTPTHDGTPTTEPPRRRSGGGPSVGTIATVGAITAIGIAILASRNKDKDPERDTGKETAPTHAPAAPAPPVATAPPEPARPPVRSAVVPEVRGMSAEEAERTIAGARLQARTTNPSDAAVAGAKVASQIPSAGTPVVPGASVAVTFEPPPAPAVPTPPPAVVVTPPVAAAPPTAPRIVRAPRPPAAPTFTPVLPSSPIAGLIEAPRPIVPIVSVPVVPVVAVEPVFPWALIVLIALGAALASIATYRSARPPAPRLTVIPKVDAGEQRIVAGGRSRSLDLAFSLDDGVQQIHGLKSRVRIGAMS